MPSGKKRILYIQPYSWDCGPHQSLKALLRHLDRNLYEPIVLLRAPCPTAPGIQQMGIEVLYQAGIRITPRTSSIWQLFRFFSGFWLTIGRLARLIKREKIDIVHTNSEACWVGGAAARIARVPSIAHLRGLSILSPRWVGFISTRLLNLFNHILIATSHSVKNEYVKAGARPGAIRVVCNGIDLHRFDPSIPSPILRTEFNLNGRQSLIGMIANLDPRKGHDDFILACSRIREEMPDAHFVIIGETKLPNTAGYYERLLYLVKELKFGNSFHFTGLRQDIPEILASLDVVVQPSLMEAGPRVPLEAMAMKRPLVVSNAHGNKEEVLDQQTGLVVPLGDIHEISTAILKLLRNQEMSKRLGEAGRFHVQKYYSEEVYAKKVQDIYLELLGRRNHRNRVNSLSLSNTNHTSVIE